MRYRVAISIVIVCLGPSYHFITAFLFLAIDVVGYIFPGDSCMPVRLLALLNVW